MKDSAMVDNDFSNDTSENESEDCLEIEISREGPTTTIHDHPFSIESILHGRTKRRKRKEGKNSPVSREDAGEENKLALSALEEFTNKTFSTMKPERRSDKHEGKTTLFYFFVLTIFHMPG